MHAMNVDDFVASLSSPETARFIAEPREIVVDKSTGRARQAGAAADDGAAILTFKRRAEESLYVFAKGVLGLDRLTPSLHLPVCKFLQKTPPRRKLLLLPRDHLKTSIVSRALVMHLLLQPKESNAYLPGREGRDTRILLATEESGNAENQLGWIERRFETNRVLRALWPHCVWDNPRRDTKKWNTQAMLLPRIEDFPEATIETIGVGGAITGHHYDVMVKDDLTTLKAANSPTVMDTAIQWHEASRALADDPERLLEFIAATRWSVHDLPAHIIDTDPSVEVLRRAVVEDGVPIFPEMFSLATISDLQKRLGTLFPLLYMNEAADPSLVDFDMNAVRACDIGDGVLVYDTDDRDVRLAERFHAPKPPLDERLLVGRPLLDVLPELTGRGAYVRLRGPTGRPWLDG